MLATTFILAVSALSTFVSAQANFTTCCDINPGSEDTNTRLSWCRAQQNTCPLLCRNGQTSINSCDSNTLTYNCTCMQGTTPNISDYAQTLPSLECDSWKRQCTNAHPNDLNGQTFCQSFACGRRNATAEALGTSGGSSGSASASASATTSRAASAASSAATSAASAATTSRAAAVQALKVGSEYGTAGVAIGLMALFGFAL